MKDGRNPSTFGIFFGALAYVIEYRNFRASDAWHSGDFYMGSGERPAEEVFQDGTKKKCMVLRYDWISLIKKSCNICLSGNESM